jgi:hypothetical protein
MKIFEYVFNQPEGSTTIIDTSGLNNNAEINPVRPGAAPAKVVSGFAPTGYPYNSLKFSVDDMPTSHGSNIEPDDQLQFLRIPVTPSILNINNTRAFTLSFWAYHEVKPDPGGNPWDGPTTLADKPLFCPQHTCGAEAFYIFVRTKNIGTSVPISERGELAFTGDGPAIVQAGGIDTTGLGGTTSQGYHVPINTWVHIACVLSPPSPVPGKWQIFVDGSLKGETDALPGLADPTTKIFSTDAAGNPAAGVDIRFGNFRGHFPPDGVQRPAPIAAGANDYAYHGYLTGIRMYDHAQKQSEILAEINSDTKKEGAMAVHLVKNYVLRYDLDTNRPWVIVHYDDNGQTRNVNFFPPKEDAVYLADMLRNEKPVHYVDIGTKKWLTTSAEQIGEEES